MRTLWTSEEEDYLRANAAIGLAALASHLNRTPPSVRAKLYDLGLVERKRTSVRRWTREDVAKLHELSERHTFAEIAKRMGRTYDAVKCYMLKEGVRPYNDTYSVRGVCDATGYAREQVVRAGRKLQQTWRTAYGGRRKRYLITYTQMEQICEYLKNEPRRIRPAGEKFWPRVTKTDDHWLWTGPGDFEYIYPDGTKVSTRPSRVAWQLTYGPPPTHHQVFRTCAVEKCVRPEHLKLIQKTVARHLRTTGPTETAA